MKTIKFSTIIMAVAIIFNSCSKGDTGPAGPTGPQGATGNANVISSTYTITPGSWSTLGTGEYGVNLSDGSLNNVTADEVSVSVSETSGEFLGLPATDLLAGGDNMVFAYENNQVSIIYLNSSAPTVSLEFKVVVIPPAQ